MGGCRWDLQFGFKSNRCTVSISVHAVCLGVLVSANAMIGPTDVNVVLLDVMKAFHRAECVKQFTLLLK